MFNIGIDVHQIAAGVRAQLYVSGGTSHFADGNANIVPDLDQARVAAIVAFAKSA